MDKDNSRQRGPRGSRGKTTKSKYFTPSAPELRDSLPMPFSRGKTNKLQNQNKLQNLRTTTVDISALPHPSTQIQLSTVPTAEKDDRAFIAGNSRHIGPNMMPKGQSRIMRPECAGFPALCQATFSHFSDACGPAFAKRVSEAMLNYYHAVILWAKLLYIHDSNGFSLSPDERKFLLDVSAANYPVGSIMQYYLDGFGNIVTNGCDELIVQLLARPIYLTSDELNLCGWFGPIGPNTHYFYMYYPCLAVYAMRICQDVIFTTERGIHQAWNLPPGICPVDVDAGLPTNNLLGYGTSVKLRSEMIATLSDCGINGGRFYTVNNHLPYNIGLMQFISLELRNGKMKVAPVKFSPFGSCAQIPFVENSDSALFPVGGNRIFIDNDLVLRSPQTNNPRVVHAAKICAYRCVRNSIVATGAVMEFQRPRGVIEPAPPGPEADDQALITYARMVADFYRELDIRNVVHDIPDDLRHNWCIYTWNEYHDVPEDWIATRNIIRTGEYQVLEAVEFSSADFRHNNCLTTSVQRLNTGV